METNRINQFGIKHLFGGAFFISINRNGGLKHEGILEHNPAHLHRHWRLAWLLSCWDGLLYALIAFVVIDYLTGVMCAINDRTLSSEVGFKGICRKVLIFLLVGIAHILDVNVIGSGGVLRTAVIFFYISNEGVSLLENAGHLGLPIPEKIKTVLEQLHDRAENGKEGNE